MAGYRQFHTQFWKDEWLIELDPLERYLFSYLFTNDLSSISGIYKLPMRVIQNETGLDPEFIKNSMQKFQDAKKIFYKDGIIWIVNMHKYHKNASPRTMKKVNADVQNIPDCDVKTAYQYYENTGIYCIDTVSIPCSESESVSVSESVSESESESVSESESESEPQNNNDDNSSVDNEFGTLCTAYEKNIGVLTPMIAEEIKDSLDEYGLQNCVDAISEALKNNVRKWSYVNGILTSWKREDRFPSNGNSPPKKPIPRPPVTKILLPDGTIRQVNP